MSTLQPISLEESVIHNKPVTIPMSARISKYAVFLVALLSTFATCAIGGGMRSAAAAPPIAKPESVGFSSERLRGLDGFMQEAVDRGQYAGIVTLVARHGRVVHLRAVGKGDLDSRVALKPDAIFRIFSMTKPIMAAAMMMLYEEGKWAPADSLVKFIPQFAGLKVYEGLDADGNMRLETTEHAPTMHELMTMTAGFSYGFSANPVDKAYRDDHDQPIFASGSLQAMIDRLARAPLLYQPGNRWVYSLSADIQGYLVERWTGMTLPDFMRKRIFAPLKMTDTNFYVERGKLNRYAKLYQLNEKGRLTPTDGPIWPSRTGQDPPLPMGGAGLVSTAMDYFRFAQMLLNGGQLDGVRILSSQSVKLMMSNHLADRLMSEFHGGDAEFNQPRPGVGYGFDGVVITDPGQADVPLGKGSYFWDGGGGTWFWVDPVNDLIVIGMLQRTGWPQLEPASMALVYQALLHPEM